MSRSDLNGAPARAAAAETNLSESPLAWLRRRKDRGGEAMISPTQFEAGERLRSDFWFAQMTPRVTVNWAGAGQAKRGRKSGMSFRGDADLRDEIASAEQRVRRALAAVGPELNGVLIDVCCHLKGLEVSERAAGWPQRSGKVVLQLALTRLARHYGLESMPGSTQRAPARVRHWGTQDYRPSFEVPQE